MSERNAVTISRIDLSTRTSCSFQNSPIHTHTLYFCSAKCWTIRAHGFAIIEFAKFIFYIALIFTIDTYFNMRSRCHYIYIHKYIKK